MAKAINKLTAKGVLAETVPGYHGDGNGLWLQVSGSGSKSWVFRFTRHGKAQEMGLGALHAVSLLQARTKAAACRSQLDAGINPIEARRAVTLEARKVEAKALTFSQCVTAFMTAHSDGWKNPKHRQQWQNTLDTYAAPFIGNLDVSDVDTGLVLQCLEPIWKTKNETASRLRGRIESVLAWATTRGYRQGENPARWKGHLDTLLAKPSKLQTVKHHAALPYVEMRAFMPELAKMDGIGARALEFAILTAARSGEVRGAVWSEIDMENRIWIVPAERMKAGKEHRVPLSDRVIKLLESLPRLGDYVFPGVRDRKPLSDMSLTAVLKRMERADLTAHGFRSTFRDWAAEQTAYPSEVVEMALAHTVGNKVEAAYRRGDLLEKRVRLMVDWAKHCYAPAIESEAKNILPIRAKSA
jgi:integrase